MSAYENLHEFKAQKFISYNNTQQGQQQQPHKNIPLTSSLDDIMEENEVNPTETQHNLNTVDKSNDPQSPCSINLKNELLDELKQDCENVQNNEHED
ncbi:hypothetical protein pb186bvf_018815 [Paramecium bursaria]